MPLLWLSLAFISGIGIAQAVGGVWWAWALPGLIFTGAAFMERRWLGDTEWWPRWRQRSFLPIAALAAAFCLGGLRYASSLPAWGPGDLAWYQPASVRVQAVIAEPPQPLGNGTRLFLEAEQVVLMDGQGQGQGEAIPVRGRLTVSMMTDQGLCYGDRVEVSGELAPLPESLGESYRQYLVRKGISSYMAYPRVHWLESNAGSSLLTALYQLRESGVRTLNAILPQPESSLLAGILLGEDGNIPDPVQEAFRETGTAHLIAISGSNIAILIGLFIMLFRRWLPRPWAVLLASAAIFLYTLLVGAQASVVRAAVMGGMGLVGAELLGRRQAGVNSLALTAALMALFDPLVLWDLGFQLSFAATLGMILLGGPLQLKFTAWLARRLPSERAQQIARPVGEYFLLTLAAQLATLPVILGSFGNISLSTVLANPLVLPVQPLVMILGGISLLAGWIWLPLGQLLAGLVWPLLAFTIRVVEWLGGLSGEVTLTGPTGWIFAALFYSLIFGLGVWQRALGRWFTATLGIVSAGLAVFFLARMVLAAPDGRLHLLVLDGGNVPVLFIRAPAGDAVLVNGGGNPDELENSLGRWLSPLDTSLDTLVVVGKSREEVGALPALLGDRYRVSRVLWNKKSKATNASEDLLVALQAQGVPLEFLQAGQELDLGSGAGLRVEAVAAEGAALLLEWGDFDVLIPGGIALEDLPGGMSPALLVLNTEDLANNSAEEWSRLEPGLVIWAGKDAQQAQYSGITWVALEHTGWLHFTTDGWQAWAESGP